MAGISLILKHAKRLDNNDDDDDGDDDGNNHTNTIKYYSVLLCTFCNRDLLHSLRREPTSSCTFT